MQRLLQLSVRSLISSSTLSGLSGPLAIRRQLVESTQIFFDQQRPISISLIRCKQQNSSSSSSSSNDQRGGKKKRSIMDVANETLENAGLKTRSSDATGGGKRNIRDNQRGTDDTVSDRHPRGQSPQRKSGSWGDSTTNVDNSNQRSSERNRQSKKSALDHRAAGPVRHDKKSKQFLLDLGDNQVARIEYRQIGKNLIELHYTEVPKALRGKGIGRALAKGALENALKANLRLKVTCEYLRHYLERYADEKYKKLVD